MSTPQELAAAKLLVEIHGWRSIELQVHIDQANRKLTAPGRTTSDHAQFDFHYIETAKGQRYGDELARSGGGSVHDEAFCDGKRCANLHYEFDKPETLKSVTIERNFLREGGSAEMESPVPLRYFYAGKVPLDEAIVRAVHLGSSRVIGRDCDVFHISGVSAGNGATFEEILHLDRATGVPLRLEWYGTKSEVAARRWNRSWEASSLDTVQGYHFPLTSSFQSRQYEGPESTARFILEIDAKVDVKTLNYDRTYTATTFWPEPRSDVPIIDSFTGKITVPSTIAEANVRMLSAGQPEGGTLLSTIGTWSLGLGFAILATGLIFWVRRRSQSTNL